MPDYFYVYPAYLDRSGSRADGRRVGATDAADELTLDRIVAAARSIGLVAEAQPEKQYPRQFHVYAGRVKVMKKSGLTKAKALRAIAAALRSAPPAAKGA